MTQAFDILAEYPLLSSERTGLMHDPRNHSGIGELDAPLPEARLMLCFLFLTMTLKVAKFPIGQEFKRPLS